jgi:hypothetical protein
MSEKKPLSGVQMTFKLMKDVKEFYTEWIKTTRNYIDKGNPLTKSFLEFAEDYHSYKKDKDKKNSK